MMKSAATSSTHHPPFVGFHARPLLEIGYAAFERVGLEHGLAATEDPVVAVLPGAELDGPSPSRSTASDGSAGVDGILSEWR